MKKVLSAAVLLAAAAAAFGAMGDVVGSFASPAQYPLALARATSDSYLWVFTQTTPFTIWRIHATTGSVYGSYPTASSTKGLSYQFGGYLYVGDSTSDYIYRHNSDSIGSIYSSYAANCDMYGGLAVKATGDGGSGATEIWSTDTSPATAYLHNISTGSITSSFTMSFPLYDPAWDWRNNLLWVGSYSPQYIFGITTAGSVAASFPSPAEYPWGATYFGSYLWISCTTPVHRIYRIHCPQLNVGIGPTSLGRVKAIYK